MDLTPENIFGLLKSTEDYPVDFEDAWRWIGYSTKGNAKRKLESDFIRGLDYTVINDDKRVNGNQGGGSVSFERINLTTDCFKAFAMMAGTATGREVRQYFLDCERKLKGILQERRTAEAVNQRLIDATQKVYLLDVPVKWKKRGRMFQEDFYNHVYRLKGKQRPQGNHPIWMAQVTIDVIYRRLQPGIWESLCSKNPRINGRRKHCCHQFLSDNIGNPHLRNHLYGVTKTMKGSSSWNQFQWALNQFYPKTDVVQMDLLFELFSQSQDDFETWKRLVG